MAFGVKARVGVVDEIGLPPTNREHVERVVALPRASMTSFGPKAWFCGSTVHVPEGARPAGLSMTRSIGNLRALDADAVRENL